VGVRRREPGSSRPHAGLHDPEPLKRESFLGRSRP
jgi:hypothetical protein